MASQAQIMQKAAGLLRQGDARAAATFVRSALTDNNDDSQLWAVLALCNNHLGDDEGELDALERSLGLDPENIKALLMAGALFERREQFGMAIKRYQAAIGFAEKIGSLPPSMSADIRNAKSRLPALISGLEKQTLAVMGEVGFSADHKQDARMQHALDILFGRKSIYLQEPYQLYVPELPQRQFYRTEEFDWTKHLMGAWEKIASEATDLLTSPELFRPYLESKPGQPANEHIAMLDNPEWSSFYLIKDGTPVEKNLARCPHTAKAIDGLPLCAIEGQTPSVLFSWLKPGAHIPPHNGMLNARLICHLPLIIPEKCGIRVGNQQMSWTEGELLIFDDTIEHEAWNKSQSDRLVMIFDVWRPEITEREKQTIAKLMEFSGQ